MDSSPLPVPTRGEEDTHEVNADSFEMPKMNVGDYDASGLMDNLSISGTPAFKGRYDDSDLLADDSYEYEMRRVDNRNGRDQEDRTLDDDFDDQSEGDQTVMRDDDVPRTKETGEPGASGDGGRGTGSTGDAQRDERLKAALFELKKMNEVFENYARALEAARHHNERLAKRTAQTSQLLDQYVSLLSQTEHTQQLILDKRWTGVNDDNRVAEDEERMRIEEEERHRHEGELSRLREVELQNQRDREREARERAAAAAVNATSSGARSGASRLGVGRGTRGAAVSGARGSVRGRAVGSGVARSASTSLPALTTGNTSGIRKPSGSYTNVRSSGYGPPRTRP